MKGEEKQKNKKGEKRGRWKGKSKRKKKRNDKKGARRICHYYVPRTIPWLPRHRETDRQRQRKISRHTCFCTCSPHQPPPCLCLSVCLYVRLCLLITTVTTLCLKKIPDIFDFNFKTNYQTLIVFGTNIPDTTCQCMLLHYLGKKDQAEYVLK